MNAKNNVKPCAPIALAGFLALIQIQPSPVFAQSLLTTPTPVLPSENQQILVDNAICVQQMDDLILGTRISSLALDTAGLVAEVVGAIEPTGVTEAAAISIQVGGVVSEATAFAVEETMAARDYPNCDARFAGTVQVTQGGINVSGNSIFQNGVGVVGNLETGGSITTATGNITTESGNITTADGTLQAGSVTVNAGQSGKISGLSNGTISPTSTDAVTGQQLNGINEALLQLDAREAAHFQRLMKRADKAYQGVAMGFAANAAPLNLANGEGGMSAGFGFFEGEWAVSVKAQKVTESGLGLGANFGAAKDAVGGGIGASIKF